MREHITLGEHESVQVNVMSGTFSLYCQLCGKNLRVTDGRLNDPPNVGITRNQWANASPEQRRAVKKYLYGMMVESDCQP